MKLLLLDKDGTLTKPTTGEFVDAPWHQQTACLNVLPTLYRYRTEGWQMAICSNQGGVEAGHKSLEQTFLEFRYCLELFPMIKEAFFCPDFEGRDCWQVWDDCKPENRILYGNGWTSRGIKLASFRKPDPGMLQLACDIHVPDEVLYVGDRPEDEQAALAAGIPFMDAEEWWNAAHLHLSQTHCQI